VNDDAVVVRCTPVVRAILMTGRRRGSSVNAGRLGYSYRGRAVLTDGEGEIVEATLGRPAHAPYGRLELTDRHGRRAWTNPLWM
jgi:hypothetical protein